MMNIATNNNISFSSKKKNNSPESGLWMVSVSLPTKRSAWKHNMILHPFRACNSIQPTFSENNYKEHLKNILVSSYCRNCTLNGQIYLHNSFFHSLHWWHNITVYLFNNKRVQLPTTYPCNSNLTVCWEQLSSFHKIFWQYFMCFILFYFLFIKNSVLFVSYTPFIAFNLQFIFQNIFPIMFKQCTSSSVPPSFSINTLVLHSNYYRSQSRLHSFQLIIRSVNIFQFSWGYVSRLVHFWSSCVVSFSIHPYIEVVL